MAAPKRPTHEVVHPKLYMAVGGVLQHVEKGTPLVLSPEQVKSLGKKVKVLGEKETVDLTEKVSDKSDKPEKDDTKK